MIGCVLYLPCRDFARARAFYSTQVDLFERRATQRHAYIPKSINVALAIGHTEQCSHLLE